MHSHQNPIPVVSRKPRGCFGCLLQCTVVLVLDAVLLIALTGLFYTWAFYLGGKFHIMPMWQGLGKAHAKSGDYFVWVQFEPTPRGSKVIYRATNLRGQAYVCTQRGEKFPMHLGGGMPMHLKLSTDGEAVSLYMYYWPLGYGGFNSDHRPSLEFRGNWHNPNLVMDDHGSIGRAFQPDGSVYRGHESNRPYMQELVPITFVEGSRSEFDKACAAVRR
ncbi:MAG TPA: hypothetical protein VFA90_16975 [Terriglobales bacterium]|nr:hypothetical protein [Terriglobales bacterium]